GADEPTTRPPSGNPAGASAPVNSAPSSAPAVPPAASPLAATIAANARNARAVRRESLNTPRPADFVERTPPSHVPRLGPECPPPLERSGLPAGSRRLARF